MIGIRAKHCSGGAAVCDSHREGPLCALCSSGYRSATLDSECVPCPSEGQSVAYTVGILALVTLGYVICDHYALLSIF
jgi:hypothetical protein